MKFRLTPGSPPLLVTALAVAVALLVRWPLWPLLGGDSPYLTPILAVIVSAANGGLRHGWLATLIGGPAALVLIGLGEPALPSRHLAGLALFLAAGLCVSGLCEALHAARRDLEREAARLRESEARGRELAEQLSEDDRRKDEFLAVLGHELRNPLAPLRNAAELLRLAGGDDPDGQMTAVIDRQVTYLTRLVDDLLDASRIARGKVQLCLERLDANVIANRAAEAVRPQMEDRRHNFSVDLATTPLWLEADTVRLEQVLVNLLTNAARYTEPGGHVWLSVAREEGEAVLSVRDSGIGIRQEMLAKVFDPFQQADRIPGRAAEGLGIGLTLVKDLVELHGGLVEAQSAGPGRGSTFTIRLPARSRRTDTPTVVQATDTLKQAERPLRVLVTDDNADAAESLATLLRQVGHEVRTATDGPQALEVARDFRPEVAFLDIGLPSMSGYELALHLRHGCGLEGLFLVALSGYGQSGDVEQARAAGFDHHLTKPADPAQIRTLLLDRQTVTPVVM